MKLKFVRNFSVEPIEIWLAREARAMGISLACEFGGFASAADDIQKLGIADTNLAVLALGLEMSSGDFGHASWSAQAACERHLVLVEAAIANSVSPLVINTALPPLTGSGRRVALPGGRDHALLVDELNVELRKLAVANAGKVALVDWVQFARELGEQRTYDHRFWLTSGAPFAPPFLARYAQAIAGAMRALSGRTKKCVVLDCDNTLWGGIIGEDGLSGIRLSSDTLPGAYFQTFQRAVLDLHARGVAVALCSKNDEADVLDVLDHHPDCLLQRKHLASWRINWNDKAGSIREIAEELNIGLDSIVFVDDSPQECELVRQALPQVLVRQVPSEPAQLIGFLDRQDLFDPFALTTEDVQRTHTYQQNRARHEFSASLADMADYKAQLQTRLNVRIAAPADLARVAQLLQRTNQFNLTTRRHDPVAVQRFSDDPNARVLCAELSDRFGDLGTIAIAIVLRRGGEAVIDSMLMSCRALGRDAELAFASAVYATASREWHSTHVVAEYVATAKNSLVADFWDRAGLERSPANDTDGVGYRSNGDLVTLAAAIAPQHVTLTEQTSE